MPRTDAQRAADQLLQFATQLRGEVWKSNSPSEIARHIVQIRDRLKTIELSIPSGALESQARPFIPRNR